jgi:hypothetical protein
MWTLLLVIHHLTGSQHTEIMRIQTASQTECVAKGEEFRHNFLEIASVEFSCAKNEERK